LTNFHYLLRKERRIARKNPLNNRKLLLKTTLGGGGRGRSQNVVENCSPKADGPSDDPTTSLRQSIQTRKRKATFGEDKDSMLGSQPKFLDFSNYVEIVLPRSALEIYIYTVKSECLLTFSFALLYSLMKAISNFSSSNFLFTCKLYVHLQECL
jgi:hypothetical protein